MKKLLSGALATCWLGCVATAFAQMEMPGSPAGVNAALTKLFGDVRAFSAKADVRVLDKARRETISTPIDFALLDGKIRVEVDINRVKNKDLPAAAAARMKEFGMDRIVSVIRPDKQTSYVVFPGVQSYVTTPLAKEDLETYTRNAKLEKTSLGKETLDGRPCVKNQEVVTDHQGRKREATVWRASDLQDFPVQIQTQEDEDTVILRYRQVQLARPDAKQFEPPAGFKSYDDMQALIQGVMMKTLGQVVTPR